MMVEKIKRGGILRSGYTTGACAAAAAKAATLLLVKSQKSKVKSVEIPFPGGNRHKFKIHGSGYRIEDKTAWSSVIKDAGDDPDVTNGAEIVAEISLVQKYKSTKVQKSLASRLPDFRTSELIIKGGKGVGIVTKPGLSVPVGESAINPVPRKMIKEAVMEAISSAEAHKNRSAEAKDFRASELPSFCALEITISVPGGEELAKKTLNQRLGIVGGISILGTTGIVKPLSTEAWTASISSAMDVAVATGNQEIALSAGRVSEKAHMKKFNFPEEAYIMMGDYLEFSLLDAKKHQFKKIHLCAQWAKTLKIAMATPQTHVRHGAIDTRRAVEFLNNLGIKVPQEMQFNTAREIFDLIQFAISNQQSAIFSKVCSAAKKYVEGITSGVPVTAHLVSYEGEIIVSSE